MDVSTQVKSAHKVKAGGHTYYDGQSFKVYLHYPLAHKAGIFEGQL